MGNRMKQGWVFIGLCALIGFASSTAGAADCNQAGNLLSNCDFTTDMSEWIIGYGQFWTHEPADGATAPGCVEVKAETDGTNWFASIGYAGSSAGCIPFPGNALFETGLSARYDLGQPGVQCRVNVYYYSDASCSTYLSSFLAPLTTVGNTWTEVFYPGNVSDPATQAAVFQVFCRHTNDFEIRLDDVLFGQGLVPVELMSFSVE